MMDPLETIDRILAANNIAYTGEDIRKELDRAGFVIVPREASHIMCMRGAQADTGWFEPHPDAALEYFKFDPPGDSKLQDALAPKWNDDDDDRWYWLVGAIWRGCIKGMEEWQRLRQKEGGTKFVEGWEQPCLDGLRKHLDHEQSAGTKEG